MAMPMFMSRDLAMQRAPRVSALSSFPRCVTASPFRQQRPPSPAAVAAAASFHTVSATCSPSSRAGSSSSSGSGSGGCGLVKPLCRQQGRQHVTVRAEGPGASGSGLLESSEQQAAAYNVLTAVYGVLASVLTVAPGWALETGLRVAPTEFTTCCMGVFASYMWIAVGVAVCLKEAAVHSRLSSDTYKRLNLGLMYSALTLTVLQVKCRAVTNPALISGYVAVGALTAFVCGRTYAWSSGGFRLKDVASGLVSGIKDLLRPKGPASALYCLLTGVYLICWVLLFATDAHPLFLGDIGPVGQYLKRKMGAGMLLAGVVHYTLKDAADRGRLGASTFKQLNLAVSLFCIVGGWYFYRMWVAGVPVLQPLMYGVLAMAAVSTCFCDYQFLFAKK